MDDGAAFPLKDGWLVLTTDSHVVAPRFFPGGDVGRLSISGTVNDLSMMGATEVLGLTCARGHRGRVPHCRAGADPRLDA